MDEPSLHTSRLAIAAALAATAVVGGTGFYLGRASSPGSDDPQRIEPAPTLAPLPAVSDMVAESILDRAELIELAAAAADAASSGAPLPAEVREAVDKRFEIAIPFGCSGAAPSDSEAPLRWRYDEAEEALRLHVAVTRWEAADWGLDWPGEERVIEGFWVERPWSSDGACPPPPDTQSVTAIDAPPAAQQTLALAQFFGGDVRREALRQDRPYQSVQRIAQTDFAAPRGFRLMLTGRIDRVRTAAGAGGPVHCIQPGGAEQRPRCIVAVTLDEVRIESPASGEVLASWQIGRN